MRPHSDVIHGGRLGGVRPLTAALGLACLALILATLPVGRAMAALPAGTTPSAAPAISTGSIGNPVSPTVTTPSGRVEGSPDPWIQQVDGTYYMTYTSWDRIEVRTARTLAELSTATPKQIWPTPGTTLPAAQCCNLWAPEFHLLDGPHGRRWYLYFSAEPRDALFFSGHRMYVAESQSDSPLGPYGPGTLLDTRTTNLTIDGTVLQRPDGSLYMFFGHTPPGKTGTEDLYVQRLSNPWTTSGEPLMIASATEPFEQVGGTVVEGPEVLERGDRLNIVYSGGIYLYPSGYSLGLLSVARDADLMNPATWVNAKQPGPILTSDAAAGVYAPGHNSFFTSPDGTETWIMYHAYSDQYAGLFSLQPLLAGQADEKRSARVQKISWAADNTPVIGKPVAPGVVLTAPSGDPGVSQPLEKATVSSSRAVLTRVLTGQDDLVGLSGLQVRSLATNGEVALPVTVPADGTYRITLRLRRSTSALNVTLRPRGSSTGGVSVSVPTDSSARTSVNLGTATLAGGAHTLTVRLPKSLDLVVLDELILART